MGSTSFSTSERAPTHGTAFFRWALILFSAFAVAACASQVESTGDARFSRLWMRYTGLPSERALVIAGDPDRRWVGSAVGGHASRAAAESAAFAECDERRIARRLQARCRLYAVGDEIVWRSR